MIKAAIGAQITPPIMRGMARVKSISGSMIMNVAEIVSVIKNSARLTEPIAFLGLFLFIISEGVAIGPHPQPPTASIKAAPNPRGISLLILGIE